MSTWDALLHTSILQDDKELPTLISYVLMMLNMSNLNSLCTLFNPRRHHLSFFPFAVSKIYGQ